MNTSQILEKYSFDVATGVFIRHGARPKRGIVQTAKGYIRVLVNGRYFMAHHLVWVLLCGRLPSGHIDHINGDRSDNRPSNLREVTALENSQNQRHAHSTSSTGLIGSSPICRGAIGSSRWRAQIKVDGRSVHLGMFGSPEEAHKAYVEAKRRLHPGCTI